MNARVRKDDSAASASDDERLAQLAKLGRFIENLMRENFFGKVTVSFQNGRVADIRTEQVTKLDEM